MANRTNGSVALTPDMMFNDTYLMSIVCYSIVFVFAAVGNVTMLLILLRNLRKARLNRVYTLLLNLNVADLIVTFFHMPKEIAHSSTVQWLGPDWLCRLGRYLDVFGIYLSSNVLICLSLDRFFAIVWPFYSFTSGRRVKFMLTASWIVAICSGLPQVYTFCKAAHPDHTWYTQCIASPTLCDTGNSTQYVLFNTALNALEIYILPFLVIVVCYVAILVKIFLEARYGQTNSTTVVNGTTVKLSLRRSSNCYIRRAKSKTLRMTIVIVVTFLICWSPYFIMVLLHFADMDMRTGNRRAHLINLPPMAEKFLYIFAIFNSCINPYLYGYYSFKLGPELQALRRSFPHYCCFLFGSGRRDGRHRFRRAVGGDSVLRTGRSTRALSLDMNSYQDSAAPPASADQKSVAGGAKTALSPETPVSRLDSLRVGQQSQQSQQSLNRKQQPARPPLLLVNSMEIDVDGGGSLSYCSSSDL